METLLAHAEDLASRALKTGCAASKFLTPAEAALISQAFRNRREVALLFDGGYEGAERTLAVFLQPQWGTYNQTGTLAALRLDFRSQDALGHRDILGALMALGIERNVIGDIFADTRPAVMICRAEMAAYITENFKQAGRVGLTISRMATDEIPAKVELLDIKTVTVASLRLDAMLSAAFRLSRSEAAVLIAAGKVSLSHIVCENLAKEVSAGSIISVKGLGRAKIISIGGQSRKGRLFVEIGIYV